MFNHLKFKRAQFSGGLTEIPVGKGAYFNGRAYLGFDIVRLAIGLQHSFMEEWQLFLIPILKNNSGRRGVLTVLLHERIQDIKGLGVDLFLTDVLPDTVSSKIVTLLVFQLLV